MKKIDEHLYCFCIVSQGGNCAVKEKKNQINTVIKRSEKIIKNKLLRFGENFHDLCVKRLTCIIKDTTHPLFNVIIFSNRSFRLIHLLARYPFNLERKKHFYLFPMKPNEKNDFWAKKKRFLVAILTFSDETGIRFFEPLDFTIQNHRTGKFAI